MLALLSVWEPPALILLESNLGERSGVRQALKDGV
jgi:hypothetical protein